MNDTASVPRRHFPARWSLFIAAIPTLIVLCLIGAWRLARPRVTVAPRHYVRYDDFAFTVLDAKREPGTDTNTDQIVFTVECQNRAKRVPFTFKPEIIKAMVLPRSPKELTTAKGSWSDDVVLKAGESCRRTVIVNAPKNLKDMSVLFQTGGAFGDFMDGLLDQNYEIEVPIK